MTSSDEALAKGAPPSTGLHFPKAAPNGLVARILLAFLTTAGLFYVNIMSALVAGLIEGLDFSKQEAGVTASANVYGAALGALIVVFVVKRLPWRRAALAALIALLLVDVISVWVTTATVLTPLRFIHGMIGGFLVGIGFSVIARTQSADKTFAVLLVLQFGLGGLGVMTIPRLVPIYGHEILFFAMIAFSLATLIMLPFIAEYPMPKGAEDEDGNHVGSPQAEIKWMPLILTLIGIFLFQAANMGLGAYMIVLGQHYGGELGFVSTTIGIAGWVGAIGSIMVAIFGTRFGRGIPLAIAFILTMIGIAAFHFSDIPLIFIAANMGTAITWAFVMPYLLGLCSAFDETGRMAALGGFSSKMGLASGPFLGSFIIGTDNYTGLINISLVGFVICTAAALIPAFKVDRETRAMQI